MARKTHFKVGETQDRFEQKVKILLCGDDEFSPTVTEQPESITCPKCSAKWAKQQPDFSRVELVKSDKSRWARSCYEVTIDNKQYGFVAMTTGRYGRWYRCDHNGAQISTEKTTTSGRIYNSELSPTFSKEAAALAMIEIIGVHIKPRDEYLAEVEASNTKWRTTRQELKREKEQRREARVRAIETINAMLATGEFSNTEIDALHTALASMKDIGEID